MTFTITVAPIRGLARISERLEAVLNTLTKKRFLPVLIILIGLLPSTWLLYDLRDTPQLGLFGDDVMYVGAAESLAHDGSYREAALPGNPWETKYPPGYPLMLAAILKWNPVARNFWIIAHSWIWMAVASVTLAWAMRQTGLSRVQASVVAGLWVANPGGANAAIVAFAEAPFCAVLFLALGLAQRLKPAATWNAVMIGLLMGISCLIRTAGVVAICGLVAWLLWRRGFKSALWFGVSASILPAIWMLWSHAHMPATPGPVAQYYFDYGGRWLQDVRHAGLGPILVGNVRTGVEALGQWVVPVEGGTRFRWIAYIVLLAVSCAALLDWAGGAVIAVASATAVFQLFWNWPPNARFFLPVAPALLGAGVAMLSARPAVLRICALLVVAAADIHGTADIAWKYATERYAGLAPSFSFISKDLPSDAVILGDDRVWLFTGRHAVGMQRPMAYFYVKRPDSEMEFFRSYKDVAGQFGAQYVLHEPWDGLRWDIRFERAEELAAAMRSDPDLEPIFSQNGIELFRIRSNGLASP